MSEKGFDPVIRASDFLRNIAGEMIKCALAHRSIIEERKKQRPDEKVIADLELITRVAGEQAVRLQNEFDKRLNEAIRQGGFEVAPQARTFNLKGI